jgi:hypothetical protein
MTAQEIYNYFGNSMKFQDATGMRHGNIYNWKQSSYVPMLSQMKIERLTNGELTAKWEDAGE